MHVEQYLLDTEKKYEKVVLVLGILCKMFSDYYWDYAYCFTVESMPTVIRQRKRASKCFSTFCVSADPIAVIFVKRAMGIFDSMGSLGGCFAALVVATKYGIFVLAVACMSIVQLIW